ncbi:MAG: phage portal protein [Oscillospiraceae bacterium]|nr:phage portal protein [Oscillospiraceae bacterium]
MGDAKKKQPGIAVRIVKADTPVIKADAPTQVSLGASGASEWLSPAMDQRGLKALVGNSSILPQCIRAYKNNIAGFGLAVRYREDIKETDEMKAEFDLAKEWVTILSADRDTKEVFESVVESKETYGTAYVEVVRNLKGEVTEIIFIRDTPSVRKTLPLDPWIEEEYLFRGETRTRVRKYCKYKQEIGGKTVYYKEVGDPRVMSRRDGRYLEDGGTLERSEQANEILEFPVGTEPYGEVRWIGQILGVDGSRKAENLNNRYFEEGRHTPLLIMIKGGALTDESFDKLRGYMNDIKGEKGQHAFMVLEVENAETRAGFEGTPAPEIEIKDLASMLQKDELFQEYLDNNRRRAQSAFQLPDLYVGYTTDFNRATAQMAMEVTEKQVFQPERRSLAWAINHKLLSSYNLKYVEVYFLAPDISNPDDMMKILTVAERAGGLTPNKAKEIAYKMLGETSENYEGNWGDMPIAATRQQSYAAPGGGVTQQLEAQIKKAAAANDDSVVAVMKEVRALLEDARTEAQP